MNKSYRVEYSYQTPTGILVEGKTTIQASDKKNAVAMLLHAYKHTQNVKIVGVKKGLN